MNNAHLGFRFRAAIHGMNNFSYGLLGLRLDNFCIFLIWPFGSENDRHSVSVHLLVNVCRVVWITHPF